MECLGVEPGAAWWKAQTNPLSYGGTPLKKRCCFWYLCIRPKTTPTLMKNVGSLNTKDICYETDHQGLKLIFCYKSSFYCPSTFWLKWCFWNLRRSLLWLHSFWFIFWRPVWRSWRTVFCGCCSCSGQQSPWGRRST